jgi:hypothetical protein
VVADLVARDSTEPRIGELMVGQEATDIYPDKVAEIGDIVLQLRRLGVTGNFSDIDLDVRGGRGRSWVWRRLNRHARSGLGELAGGLGETLSTTDETRGTARRR